VQDYPAGFYRLSVKADDGVRVYLDGVRVIDQWRDATGQTYSYETNLSATPHTIVVEYYEARGDAFLEYSFQRVTAPTPAPTNPPAPNGIEQPRDTGARAVVGQYVVNIRQQPGSVCGQYPPAADDGCRGDRAGTTGRELHHHGAGAG